MKIRIGYGLGTQTTNNDESFGAFVDDLERLGFDSLWVSERISGSAPDPVVAMAFAAGRVKKLKFGMSVMVLPGRNPVLLAKQMASLDKMSGGRLLPAFGLGAVNPREQAAFGVERKQRGKLFDEALPLMRRLWTEDEVDHDGEHYQFSKVQVIPKPAQEELEVWMGGIAPSELRRIGRLADGWLPSFCTPDDVRQGIETVNAVAAEHDREIDPEHMGVLVPYGDGELPPLVLETLAKRRPDIDPNQLVASGVAELKEMLERYIEVGASKFVVVPFTEPEDWTEELERVADSVLGLHN